MNIPPLPLCISDIICAFAYNCRCKTDIFSDIDWVERVQKSIPSVFWKPFVPTMPIFQPWGRENRLSICEFLAEQNYYRDLYTPNPFVQGHPYYPTRAILFEGGIFSRIPMLMAKSLRNSAVRAHKKYKGSLLNRMHNFTAYYSSLGRHPHQIFRNLENDWNEALATDFTLEFWYDPSSYTLANDIERRLIPIWIQGLRSATFLACDVPA